MFPAEPLAPLTVLDLAIAIGLAVVLPAYVLWRHRRDQFDESEGRGATLIERYRRTAVMLWGLTALVLAASFVSGRPLADIGLRADLGAPFFIALALSALASGAYFSQVLTLRRSAKARADLADMLDRQEGVRDILPETETERQAFRMLAITAGVTEEILYRGFMIWALAHWMHPWAAAAASLLLFTLAHLYQGTARALIGVFMAGAAATLLTLVSGSLYPAMLLHFAIDFAGGEMAWLARREAPREQSR